MRKLSLFPTLLTFTALAAAVPALADFQAGLDAFQKGDYVGAAKEWRPLAEEGDPIAQFNLGLLYLDGHGVPQSPMRSRQLVPACRRAGLHASPAQFGRHVRLRPRCEARLRASVQMAEHLRRQGQRRMRDATRPDRQEVEARSSSRSPAPRYRFQAPEGSRETVVVSTRVPSPQPPIPNPQSPVLSLTHQLS